MWLNCCISERAIVWNRIESFNRIGHLIVSWSLAQYFNHYCIMTVLEEVHWKYSNLLTCSHVNNDYGYQVAKQVLTLPAAWIRLSLSGGHEGYLTHQTFSLRLDAKVVLPHWSYFLFRGFEPYATRSRKYNYDSRGGSF